MRKNKSTNHTAPEASNQLSLASATHLFAMGLAAEERVKPVILDAIHRTGLADVEYASRQVAIYLASGARVWLTSDLHFGHSNIITYAARHHRDVAQMNADLLAMLRKHVRKEDLLVIAGDLMFGEDPAVLEGLAELSDSLILVAGNHDFDKSGAFRWPRRCFSQVVPFLYWNVFGQNCLVSHMPVPVEAMSRTDGYLGRDNLGLGQVFNYHGHMHLKTMPVDQPERIVHVNVCYDHLRGMLCL